MVLGNRQPFVNDNTMQKVKTIIKLQIIDHRTIQFLVHMVLKLKGSF